MYVESLNGESCIEVLARLIAIRSAVNSVVKNDDYEKIEEFKKKKVHLNALN